MNQRTYPTAAQKAKLVAYLEIDAELSEGKFSCALAKKEASKRWIEIAEDLNSIPGAVKTWVEWRKTWQDIKCSIKKKKALLLKEQNADSTSDSFHHTPGQDGRQHSFPGSQCILSGSQTPAPVITVKKANILEISPINDKSNTLKVGKSNVLEIGPMTDQETSTAKNTRSLCTTNIGKLYNNTSFISEILNNKKYTYKYFCQDNVCRLCWTSDSSEFIEIDNNLSEEVLQCLEIDVTTHIPNKICLDCRKNVESYLKFKKSCQESDNKLRIILFNTTKVDTNFGDICKVEIDVTANSMVLEEENAQTEANEEIKLNQLNQNLKETLKRQSSIRQDVLQSITDDLNSYQENNTFAKDINTKYEDRNTTSKDSVIFSKDNNTTCEDRNITSEDSIILAKDNNTTCEDRNTMCKDSTTFAHDNKTIYEDKNTTSEDSIIFAKDNNPTYDDKNTNSENNVIFAKDNNTTYKDRNTMCKDSSTFAKDKNTICENSNTTQIDDTYSNLCEINLNSSNEKAKHNSKFHRKTFNCHGCMKIFTDISQKIKHESEMCSVTPKYQCKNCAKFLPTQKSLDSHMKVHVSSRSTKSRTCKKCSVKFEYLEDLQKHMYRHRKVTQCICETCGRIFKSKKHLEVHKLIHTSPKKLKCPHCDYRATQPVSLKYHIRLHTGEKPYACEQCPYRSVNSSNLKKHIKGHQGVKDFKCYVCDKEYVEKKSLKDHIASAHEGKKNHICKRCGAEYYRLENLRKHMLSIHGQVIRKVKNDFIEVPNGSYMRMKKDKMGPENILDRHDDRRQMLDIHTGLALSTPYAIKQS